MCTVCTRCTFNLRSSYSKCKLPVQFLFFAPLSTFIPYTVYYVSFLYVRFIHSSVTKWGEISIELGHPLGDGWWLWRWWWCWWWYEESNLKRRWEKKKKFVHTWFLCRCHLLTSRCFVSLYLVFVLCSSDYLLIQSEILYVHVLLVVFTLFIHLFIYLHFSFFASSTFLVEKFTNFVAVLVVANVLYVIDMLSYGKLSLYCVCVMMMVHCI